MNTRAASVIPAGASVLDGGDQPVAGRGVRLIRWLRSNSGRFGFALAAAVIYVGWIGRHERNITAEHGLGYALGIVGASMMAALLAYPLRKRVGWLRVLGATRHWFMFHMILGIAGPVLILYHCNFSVSDLNSKVALFCTLLVAGSGIVGRYLYAQIHQGLYGEKVSLRSLAAGLEASLVEFGGPGYVTSETREELERFSAEALEPPANVIQGAIRPFRFALSTRLAFVRMSRLLHDAASQAGRATGARGADAARNDRRLLRRHLKQVRRVASLAFFERLFSLWHILHLPFFFMLVISAIVHIVAVNMY